MFVTRALSNSYTEFPDRIAIRSKDECYTYKELYIKAASCANAILNRGLKKGDCAGVLTRKTPETIIAYLGMGMAGIVGVPISFHFNERRIRQVFDMTKPQLLFVDDAFVDMIPIVRKLQPSSDIVIIGNIDSSDFTDWDTFCNDSGQTAPGIELEEDDTFYLNFTSGSTGDPKAVATSHKHIHWNTLSSIEALNIQSGESHLCMFAGFSHPHEIFARPLWTGGTMVLLDSLYPKSIATAISRNKVNCIMGLSPMYEMLIPFGKSGQYDFSSLRLVESGGMVTRLDLQEQFRESLGVGIRPVWGSTETNGVAIAMHETEENTRSCGRTTPYYNIKIVDPDGNELPSGEAGEMIIKGPAVVDGYFNDSDETKKCFSHGWFHTGDMVMMDDDNLFYFKGRESGMMKVGGLKVYPQEIEESLRKIPEIEDVIVLPVFEKLRGEVPFAVITAKESEGKLTTKIIKDYCREALPNYMIPKKIEIRESLPVTPSGKIDRKVLLTEITNGSMPSETEELEHKIKKIDLKLLNMLNERTRLSMRLGELKAATGETLFSPGKDEATIKRILGYNSGPLHDEFIEQFFRELLQYLRRL